jgi:hypothetical protein
MYVLLTEQVTEVKLDINLGYTNLKKIEMTQAFSVQ